MRILIRVMATAIFFMVPFAIQPSATAEVASGNSYWQNLPAAVQFRSVQIWNSTVAWNQALTPPPAVPIAKVTPKTKQPKPKVASNQSPQMGGDRFDRLAQCESGGNASTNTGNGFYGAFQFVLSTWRSVGGSGLPSNASYATQKQLAIQLASVANPNTQWPVCWPKSAAG